LPSKHFQIYILAITISLFFSSCGGGTVPEYLSEARVDVSIDPKEVVFKRVKSCGDSAIKEIQPIS
jgi:hypothetical protein